MFAMAENQRDVDGPSLETELEKATEVSSHVDSRRHHFVVFVD